MELSGIRYLSDLDVAERRVFVRVDFNVPLADGAVADDSRIRAALPTLRHLRKAGCRLVLASHLGRPKGKVVPGLSLLPAGSALSELLDCEVVLPDDCVGDAVRKNIRDLPEGGVCLLENLRFHEAETRNDAVFASELASLADVYVNDAFGTAHRAHASTYGMVRHFPEQRRAAGFLIEKELKWLSPLLRAPEHPFVGIVGGAKVSDKLGVLESLIQRLDVLLIGGAMAYTFLQAKGVDVGASRVEPEMVKQAASLLRAAEARRVKVLLPVDHVVAEGIESTEGQTTDGASIPAGLAGLDVGPQTVARFREIIADAATIFWNGPLGVFEREPFSAGTFAIAHAVADSEANSIIGGGDSALALQRSGRHADVTHVSTGGGASMEFIEGRDLPGIAALRSGHRFVEGA